VAAVQYIIEEFYSHDNKGIVYHAIDAEHGHAVELHRFFPYSSADMGMDQEAVHRYQVTINFMRFWQHQSLRNVLDGGCDEIDHIPYLVSEARTGMSLAEWLGYGTLSLAHGRQLVEQALALLIELDGVFSSSAPWISLRPEDIEVFDDGSKYRFSINPIQLVDPKYEISAVKELASLVEQSMGWTGSIEAGSHLGSLSAWVQQARSNDCNAKQAMDYLLENYPEESSDQPLPMQTASSAGRASVLPGSSIAPRGSQVTSIGRRAQYGAPRATVASVKKKSALPWVIAGMLLLLGGAAAFWFLSQKNQQAQIADAKSPKNAPPSSASVSPKPALVPPSAPIPTAKIEPQPVLTDAERNAESAKKAPKMPQKVAVAKPQNPPQANKPKTAKRDGDYKPDEVALVAELVGQNISIVGKLVKLQPDSRNTAFYLHFSDNKKNVQGRHKLNKKSPAVSKADLDKFVGKTVRIKGIVSSNKHKGNLTYLIDFNELKDIKDISDAP
jgi:hypothetical protein